jgi:hypothetical protein
MRCVFKTVNLAGYLTGCSLFDFATTVCLEDSGNDSDAHFLSFKKDHVISERNGKERC